jgi:hypothetical protein
MLSFRCERRVVASMRDGCCCKTVSAVSLGDGLRLREEFHVFSTGGGRVLKIKAREKTMSLDQTKKSNREGNQEEKQQILKGFVKEVLGLMGL